MEELIQAWDGERVLSRHDDEMDTWMLIAIHSTAMGIATGGTRMKVYPTPQDALRDAMRLAEGMTYKWAGICFPRGGGKAVLGLSRELKADERDALLAKYGDWLGSLDGAFETGPDLGTSPDDMDRIRERYAGVFGCTKDAGGMGDPGPYTALGVFSGIQASCEYVFGSRDLKDRSIIVQGAGSVGAPLIGYLVETGCAIRFSDTDPDRARAIRDRFGIESVDPGRVYAEPCDVLVPCATGGILNAETIPQLSCSIIAGGANNQLERPEDADALRERGILYAPDFIINAGGALYLVSIESMGWSEHEARQEIHTFGDTLCQIYATADELGINTARAAEQLAKDRIQTAGKPDC